MFQHSTCWLLKMLLYWQSLKWFSIVDAVLFKLFWSFRIAYKYKLSMCLVVNHVVVICDCLQVHKCCNPIQVYVFRSINVMSPGGCGSSFIVTSHVVGVYMELCISLKCCNPIQVYVFRSINVMSPGGCGSSFIVTSHVVGVYMELCISLKVWDSVVHYWSWSALKFSNFKIIVQFIDPCPLHQRTPWSFCFLLRGH